MAVNRGKAFEQLTQRYLGEAGFTVFRLPDQTTGNKLTSRNPCDFLCFYSPCLYMIECKSLHGNTFTVPFSQYERLLSYKGIPGLRAGVVLWFIDHKVIVYVPIATMEKLVLDGKKSFNIKYVDQSEYKCLKIPCKFKTVNPVPEFSILAQLREGD